MSNGKETVDVDMKDNPSAQEQAASASTAAAEHVERENRKRVRIVDPDDPETELAGDKRPKINTEDPRKGRCLLAVIHAYETTIANVIPAASQPLAFLDIGLSCDIVSYFASYHNAKRQQARDPTAALLTKRKQNDAQFHGLGGTYAATHEILEAIWDAAVRTQLLEYKRFNEDDPADWYGTMGPFLNFLGGFKLRLAELRIGHSRVPLSKGEDGQKSYKVESYGLTPAHHILLEGCTFPPERKSSMIQSLGPMTIYLAMVRSEGKYRKKFEDAFIRTFKHFPYPASIVKITKTLKRASDLNTLTKMLANNALIATTRQATRMFLPLCMLRHAYKSHTQQADKEKFILRFNTTNHGGFYAYKLACNSKWYYTTQLTPEKASQAIYHAIFGTFKEDLGLLASVTNTKSWFTREDFGTGFQKGIEGGSSKKVTLPKHTHYAKMACANQSGMNTSVYGQVTTRSCFSGAHVQHYSAAFFDSMANEGTADSSGKNINEVIAALAEMRDTNLKKIHANGNKWKMGTTTWRKMDTLTLSENGEEDESFVPQLTGAMFLGQKK